MPNTLSTNGHWCEFCQMYHSSISCFHPGNKVQGEIAKLHAEIARLQELVKEAERIITPISMCSDYAMVHNAIIRASKDWMKALKENNG
jgi:hypothetical protein